MEPHNASAFAREFLRVMGVTWTPAFEKSIISYTSAFLQIMSGVQLHRESPDQGLLLLLPALVAA